MRRALAPVLAVACFRCAAFSGGARRAAARARVRRRRGVDVAARARGAADGGRVPRRASCAGGCSSPRSTQRLAARLRAHPTPEDLRRRARRGVRRSVARRSCTGSGDGEGHWGDADGHRLDPPSPAPGRAVTEVVDGDRLVAAIVHDAALEDDRAFVDTATSYAVMTLDNHRLSAQTSSLLRAVRESRARIQAAADDERRRIERDLHDGAQQRLVALRIKLELAAERTGDGTDGAERRRAAPARRRRRGGARGGPIAGARHLSRAARRPRARRGRCARRRCATRFRPRSWRPASGATRARSRAPRTSAASRRSRTPPSTRDGRDRRRDRAVATTARCGWRCATTAPASTRARRGRGRVHQHARPPGRRRRRARDHSSPGHGTRVTGGDPARRFSRTVCHRARASAVISSHWRRT